MSDRLDENLTAELHRLHQEIRNLKQDQKAFEAQNELLRTFTNLMRTSTGSLMLRSVLQQTLKIAIQFTEAEEGSLFFLDPKGTVVASVLARGATIRDHKQAIIGQVLDKGLAGWVNHHRDIGLITDTKTDDRWLTLPDEPYLVRSALGVPIFRSQTLLGILTLMHPEPGYFTEDTASLMEKTAEQMGVVLDNVRLYVEYQKLERPSSIPEKSAEEPSHEEDSLDKLGFYMLTERGKFVYANRQLANLFGYRFAELVGLESFLDLMAVESRRSVFDQIHECFQGDRKRLSYQGKGRCSDGKLIAIDLYGERTKLYGKLVIIGVVQQC
ncbi:MULTISPECIES: GAF domain-containing protein [unclassified Roseofilum]|uniref:GAF domain-containing protein n=1 Tax=unclassified Roseofilum TaxID=2620099 RepID=UPI000E811891|nr:MULTISPECIES: GAF domain-containing protein [unclassified Roseofilum]MBP0008389.1 GAF domain-containing protein [Roseofilum sp. Belize Diploria]MBP0035594.1 GAF domain-containing protein [Roseofilum sp. Belize BBD 4]HBR00186.1 diguanylate cyclase [Cyanobacteria bacterium UBA11691]